MALIGEMHYLTIGGNTYAIPISGGSTVSVTRALTSGTKTATISVDGTSYDLYAPTPNAGTITSVKTTAGAHTTINVSSGAASFNVPTKTSHLTNDSGFLTSHQDISGKANKATTLAGYGITDAYTKTQVDGLVAGVLHYKGTKATVSALPTSGNTTGDVWHVTADGSEWAWDGSAWQELGTAIDLSGYAQLSGASFTGPVTFGDSVTADELETGDLVVTGAASFTNNISANTINGVAVGSSPKFTDTNTDISTLTLATDTGTSSITLASAGKYKLTAGTKTVIFTMPTIPTVSYPVTSVNSKTGAVSLTYSDVSAASSSHTHGNITNGGDITATAPTIASGDQIIINDNSASKITNGPTFDGSTTTTALTPKGTWESFSKFSGSYNDLTNKPTIPTVPTNVSAFTNDAGYITDADIPEGASAYTGTISAVSTTAASGTSNAFARGDHVHNITSSTITSALGYTPYNSTNPNGYITASHTSTYSLPLAANGTRGGVQIGYSESGTNYAVKLSSEKMYVSVPWTDTKLQVAAVTSGTAYYPIVGSGTTAATRQYDTTGFVYKGTNGTTSVVGSAQLTLGNSTASGTANNKQGQLIMYGSNAKKATITLAAPSADIELALPTTGGTLALATQIPSVPTSTGNSKTGITATTTATKTTLGTAFTIPNVTSAGSASTWTFGATTVGDGTLVGAVDNSDTSMLVITAGTKSVQQKTGGANGSAPTLGTAFTVPNVTGNTSATVSITDNGHTHTI